MGKTIEENREESIRAKRQAHRDLANIKKEKQEIAIFETVKF